MWELIRMSWYVMIPIILCSLLGLAIFLERVITLRRKRIVVPEIVEVVETLSASEDFSVAYAICERKPGPFDGAGTMFVSGTSCRKPDGRKQKS